MIEKVITEGIKEGAKSLKDKIPDFKLSDAPKNLEKIDNSKEIAEKIPDFKKEEIKEKINNYLNEIIEAGESYGIDNLDNLKTDWEKTSPNEIIENRKEFKVNKWKYITEWENKNNQKWPTYNETVISNNGKEVRKKGDLYDAHHIQPLKFGGKNSADNLIPLHYNDHKKIHNSGNNLSNINKLLKN